MWRSFRGAGRIGGAVLKLPVSDVRSIALDTSSRTSVALTRILCARAFEIDPSLVPAVLICPRCWSGARALLIGDGALFSDGGMTSRRSIWARRGRISPAFHSSMRSGPDGRMR
jgi:predicted solute-binding protein